jgi:hypothetical protein
VSIYCVVERLRCVVYGPILSNTVEKEKIREQEGDKLEEVIESCRCCCYTEAEERKGSEEVEEKEARKISV